MVAFQIQLESKFVHSSIFLLAPKKSVFPSKIEDIGNWVNVGSFETPKSSTSTDSSSILNPFFCFLESLHFTLTLHASHPPLGDGKHAFSLENGRCICLFAGMPIILHWANTLFLWNVFWPWVWNPSKWLFFVLYSMHVGALKKAVSNWNFTSNPNHHHTSAYPHWPHCLQQQVILRMPWAVHFDASARLHQPAFMLHSLFCHNGKFSSVSKCSNIIISVSTLQYLIKFSLQTVCLFCADELEH
jgi:hypothetical protein